MDDLAIAWRPLGDLIPYARNPRTHSDAQVAQIAASIREFGWTNPVLVDGENGIIAGHGRVMAARKLGLGRVPVIELAHMSEAQKRAYVLADNQLALNAGWDDELLRLELADLSELGFDLGLIGFGEGELERLLAGSKQGLTEDDEAPSLPEQAVTRPGDLWLLGEHRLLCGDATVLEDVERVLEGQLADMTFTDPPYNVDYGSSAKDKLRGNKRKILNDDLGSGFEAFLHDACTNILSVTKGAVYICMSSSELHTLQRAFTAAGGKWSTFVIWAKHTFTLGRADYQRQYEPILYGWPAGHDRYWCGARDQGDVWFIDKPARNDLHPTMKPVALVDRAIRNSSKTRDIVLDPFGGSGSTLIACEKTGRQARLVELDPKYCDVIVQRWQDWTGETAVLDGEGRSYEEIAVGRDCASIGGPCEERLLRSWSQSRAGAFRRYRRSAMIRLAMLLVGARALKRKWWALAVLGILWLALGLAIMVDASGRLSIVTVEAIAILLLFEGFLALALFTLAPHHRGHAILVKALALLVLGCMILDFPVQVDIENSLLFGLAFLIDGGVRIATANIVRFSKWQLVAAGGVLEACLGGLVLVDWPVGYHRTVPFCIGVALLLSGWTILRLGLRLRQLTDDTPVVSLPVFEHRGWHDLGRALPPARPTAPAHHATPLVVHVWTPIGSAASPRSKHRLLIDRYIAAVDGKGMISTGHAALELAPDIYISHYPALDLDHSPEDFARLFRATADNNVKGHFQPSYAFESSDWCPADAHVEFHTYDAARLRAHWEVYRADDTYNLTNRNCSVTVALALEAALEGTLGIGTAWGRFWSLLINPDLWIAALLRARAESMTWTPGLVLDYARALGAIVEPQPSPWRRRLRLALRHLRRRHGGMAKRPA